MNFVKEIYTVLGANSAFTIPNGFVVGSVLNTGTSNLSIRSGMGDVINLPPNAGYTWEYRNVPREYKDIATFAGGACQIAYEL